MFILHFHLTLGQSIADGLWFVCTCWALNAYILCCKLWSSSICITWIQSLPSKSPWKEKIPISKKYKNPTFNKAKSDISLKSSYGPQLGCICLFDVAFWAFVITFNPRTLPILLLLHIDSCVKATHKQNNGLFEYMNFCRHLIIEFIHRK